ncbi:Peroxisomal membrane protein PEX14 [Choanephora cucurbitarum]|uniref:Peroxisomal membrane protein PEX14 n=1 Tax=Choanephora cucurbitarum TaxID=101091 RepID=A0A1C7NDK6_9FUNG|nr:Peroxisomal membrane protein PEX14 [Choanephora cucurbitarum]
MSDHSTDRQDLIKSAVSFLSSPNVQSADKEKKIAFLQKKGLTQAEIDEAFKQTNTNETKPTPSLPVLPSRTHYPQYTPPQIVYYPQPANTLPAEKVFAIAVIAGMSAFGLTASILGILRRLILPIFNRIAAYQRTRYQQRKEIADKLSKALRSFDTENDDLDALIDQGDEKTTCDALVKHQHQLQLKLDQLIQTAKGSLQQHLYDPIRTPLTDLKSTLMSLDPHYGSTTYSGYYTRQTPSNPVVSGLKSDIRSLKAVLLNRRNFPGT